MRCQKEDLDKALVGLSSSRRRKWPKTYTYTTITIGVNRGPAEGVRTPRDSGWAGEMSEREIRKERRHECRTVFPVNYGG